MSGKRSLALTVITFLAVGCSGGTGNEQDAGPEPPRLDEHLGPGEVRAGVITRESELLEGIDAHGWLGDFKLYNQRVAFVVQNIDEPRGWAPYGGTLLDADRVREEGEPGEERFEEMFLNVDILTLFPVEAEIVNDGSDGQAAVLRIRGEHRGIPLVDSALNGALTPKDLEIVQEYILDPDTDYLRIRTSLSSLGASGLGVQAGDLIFNGDTTTDFIRGKGICDEFPGGEYSYYAGFAPDVCYLYTGVEGDIQAMVSLEGITPLVAGEGVAPPRRDDVDPLVVERLLVVGGGGMDACLRILDDLRGASGQGWMTGTVADENGAPETGTLVLARDDSLAQDYDYVNQTYTGDDGSYEMQLAPGNYRIEVRAPGREVFVSDSQALSAGESVSAEVFLPPPARLTFQCSGKDREGQDEGALPCKASFQPGHDAGMHASVTTDLITFAASGTGDMVVPAGDWTVTFSRGWEYSLHRQNITMVPGETVTVEAVLQHQVNTDGYISADLHNHSTRSVDSIFEIKDKIASNICEGLDVVVLTDHDCQSDFSTQLDEMIQELSFDLGKWVRLVTGNEISPLYAHSNAYPLPTHPTGWVYWQVPWTLYEDGAFVRSLEYTEIWPQVRELGAEVIQVNHPLSSSGYFDYLGYDPPAVMPRIDSLDPVKFNPDFDAIELLNSRAVDDMLEKILPMWTDMNNQGFFRTAVGVSDSHGRTSEAGFGRTMVASSSDQPASIDLNEIWRNLRQHRAMVSGGIFVRISVGETEVGDLTTQSPPFDVHLTVEAADWVVVEQVQLLANGLVIETLDLQAPGVVDPQHPAVRYDSAVSVSPAQDTWYAAVATGPVGDNLNPVFRGARAVGMTNAIQVDVDGNGNFDPPDP